jgi:hypothetical protein
MKGRLYTLALLLILIGLILGGGIASGALAPAQPVGPQGPVGPDATDLGSQGSLGPSGSAGPQGPVGPGTATGSTPGVDWVYVVASALVVLALVVGLAIGRVPRKPALQR